MLNSLLLVGCTKETGDCVPGDLVKVECDDYNGNRNEVDNINK